MARHDATFKKDSGTLGFEAEREPQAPGALLHHAAFGRLIAHAKAVQPADAAVLGLAVAVAAVFALACFLLWSWPGAGLALVLVAVLTAVAPFVPPEAALKLYRAEPLDLRHGLPFYRMTDTLAQRAGLRVAPKLFVIPSLTVNAFSLGRPERAAIALTEGLLRRLSLTEAGAVLAHEIGHIRNGDLKAMARADMVARIAQVMWVAALVLLAVSLPAYLAGQSRMPWLAIALLFATPALANLLQLAISRRREFDADLDAVRLTGDPRAVAAALAHVERYQGALTEDLLLPSRRIPMPSLLRAHPSTEARLARLERIEALPLHPPLAVAETPMVTMVGRGPGSLRPRYRLTGLWF
jgi:heat shock protein HtpX